MRQEIDPHPQQPGTGDIDGRDAPEGCFEPGREGGVIVPHRQVNGPVEDAGEPQSHPHEHAVDAAEELIRRPVPRVRDD